MNGKDNRCLIIGIDHGNGSIKTANSCWYSDVKKVDSSLSDNTLEYNGALFELGEKPSEYTARKYSDERLMVNTLAAIACELESRGVQKECPHIHLVVGLPIGHWDKQKEHIKNYFMENPELSFSYRGKKYAIKISGTNVMPQGLVSTRKHCNTNSANVSTLDIGYGTLDYLTFHNATLSSDESGSLEYGVSKAYEIVRKAVDSEFAEKLDFFAFDNIIKGNRSSITATWHSTIETALKDYCNQVITEAKRVGYNPNTYSLHLMGGGANIMQDYAELEEYPNVSFDLDVHSNAKCFEAFCKQALRKQGVDFYE